MLLKCKMCGGELSIQPGMTVAECLYCGSLQTIPNITNEKRATLYERADYYRRNNDYDKAMSIYEQLISEDNTDAEAHWLAVLCRYGIEYVEDPRSHKRIPTVNRLQYKSILNDPDYNDALRYADDTQYDLYQQEAVLINQIQKGILEVSKREEPFDIFICYKETDNQGRRTQDSVIAYDIYKELTKEGYRVFFARVTLEDKLGSAYEPFIFAALNSAKIMLVVGTTPENFQAVWVKNEWSRYLSLMQENDNKTLIPIYKDMNPYDMPEEFSYLQSQDYGKLGAVQDIIRGVKKILCVNDVSVSPVQITANMATPVDNTNALLERAYQFLEEGNWEEAKYYYNRILDINPKCSAAFLIATMVEFKVSSPQELIEYGCEIENSLNFEKSIKYADSAEKKILEDLLDESLNKKNEDKYKRAVELVKSGNKKQIEEALNIFYELENYYDVSDEIEKSENALKIAKKRFAVRTLIVSLLAVPILFMTLFVYHSYSVKKEETRLCRTINDSFYERIFINNNVDEIVNVSSQLEILQDEFDDTNKRNLSTDYIELYDKMLSNLHEQKYILQQYVTAKTHKGREEYNVLLVNNQKETIEIYLEMMKGRELDEDGDKVYRRMEENISFYTNVCLAWEKIANYSQESRKNDIKNGGLSITNPTDYSINYLILVEDRNRGVVAWDKRETVKGGETRKVLVDETLGLEDKNVVIIAEIIDTRTNVGQ